MPSSWRGPVNLTIPPQGLMGSFLSDPLNGTLPWKPLVPRFLPGRHSFGGYHPRTLRILRDEGHRVERAVRRACPWL